MGWGMGLGGHNLGGMDEPGQWRYFNLIVMHCLIHFSYR